MQEMATKVAAKNKKRTAAKSTAGKPRTKSELFTAIAEKTDLTRRQVASVFEQLGAEIKKDIGKRAGGTVFKVGGLMTIKVVNKPATKPRKGINPFTGEEMMFKAKPASRKVKILATKALKDIVA
jgi:nucleoid DNA-binding protein